MSWNLRRDTGWSLLSLASFLVSLGASVDLAAREILFEDSFDRADGVLDGWTAAAGSASLVDGACSIGPTAAEHWIWAGDPAVQLPENAVDVHYKFSLEFLAPGSNATVGRHGGFVFCTDEPTQRFSPSFKGYFVDWIDRDLDRGVRLTRVDNGALVELVTGAVDSPAEPPFDWLIETDDTHIRVYGDGVLLIDLEEPTYRGGHFGIWAWAGDQEMLFDDIVVDGELEAVTACFTANPASGQTGEDIFFDGRCSQGTMPITQWNWDFGDGSVASGETVEHVYAFSDNYTVTLTVRDALGNSDSVSQVVSVAESLLPFEDDFDRAAGPVDGWTPASGEWSINETGQLETLASGTESWIYAGDPAGLLIGDFEAEFDMEFSATPGDGVGRHAGFMFFAQSPLPRGQTSGYFIDWIDRTADRGVRFTRVDNGSLIELVRGAPNSPDEPPRRWRVSVSGPLIRVFADAVLMIELEDETYRTGHVGFWAYLNGQDVAFDNLVIDESVDSPLAACFTASEANPLSGDPVSFDAACTSVPEGRQVTSWTWDFGDGSVGSGELVEHTYAFADNYTVTLVVEDDSGDTSSFERVIGVTGELLPFADCFDGAVGPVSDWTVHAGEWNVTEEGKLSTRTAGVEHWAWAGSPPLLATGGLVTELEIEYLFDPMDGVGRHGGIMLYAQDPTIRWQTSGYTVWWIDRAIDFGIVIYRWDDGAFTQLNDGTFDAVLDPPLVWSVEVEGAAIRVYGDDELYVEVEDETYRSGYFGLWAYSNGMDMLFDNVLIGSEDLPSCGDDGGVYRRGDTNTDGNANLSDASFLLNFLFLGGPPPDCMATADVNGDGGGNLSDASFLLNFLFLGGPTPPDPFAECGTVPPDQECGSYPEALCP